MDNLDTNPHYLKHMKLYLTTYTTHEASRPDVKVALEMMKIDMCDIYKIHPDNGEFDTRIKNYIDDYML